jgi:hypothetical protein
MTKPPLANAPLTDPRLLPSSTSPAGICASSTWAIEQSLVVSTTYYALSASTAIPSEGARREWIDHFEPVVGVGREK